MHHTYDQESFADARQGQHHRHWQQSNANDSATPSIKPNADADAPNVPAMKTGSALCTSSERVSMHKLIQPSTQTVRGIGLRAALRWAVRGVARWGGSVVYIIYIMRILDGSFVMRRLVASVATKPRAVAA